MAFTHVDLSGSGSATSPYDTWLKAAGDMQTGLTTAAAGGHCFVMRGGANVDTAGTARTLTSPGTVDNPTKLIGVLDATTNEGASIVVADLVQRGTDTLPEYESTASATINIKGSLICHGIEFDSSGEFHPIDTGPDIQDYHQCVLRPRAIMRPLIASSIANLYDSELIVAGLFRATSRIIFNIHGGEITGSVTTWMRQFNTGIVVNFKGVDLSGLTITNLVSGDTQGGQYFFTNCKMPASFNRTTAAIGSFFGVLELIASTSVTSVANTSSIADYVRDEFYGTIEAEFTKIRTDGADDGAKGGFSYKMTPNTAKVLEGTSAALKSPWLAVWVPGGAAKTLTVHIANDGAGDFNQDEIWTEFYTPDAGDTAQHDQNFDPDLARLLTSSTAVTDDTGSTWGGSVVNHQKMSATVTPGFEGWAYARVVYAKRTFDVMYVDPKIVVT